MSEYYEEYWSDTGFCPSGSTGPSLSELLTRYVGDTWSCLDLGCGDGGTAGSWLQSRVRSYVGVDISGNAVRRARTTGLNVAQIEDASSLPFGPATFDSVLCLEVLEHLIQPQVTVAEILRVLKPGGR